MSALLLACSVPAFADTIVLDVGYGGNDGHVTNFSLPQGQTVVGATVSGTYTIFFDFPTFNVRTVGYYIDGTRVELGTLPAGTEIGHGSFSYTFDASNLGQFNDGTFVVSGCANNAIICSTGSYTLIVRADLTLTTATGQTAAVPEPATALLLGTGLAGAAAARKRSRARSRPQ
ncbi:MAG TPA: PEP-CTERM sorting domain-containing protein [Pyrinomonadaceae bacterium]|nr:PEP-CTERM sorting domain-containing protein [Pyrinomonadaceae bacterium]